MVPMMAPVSELLAPVLLAGAGEVVEDDPEDVVAEEGGLLD